MAYAMKLTDDTDDFEFDPSEGFISPRILDVSRHRGSAGKGYVYKWWEKRRWEIPLEKIAKSDFDQIDTWWSGIIELTFTPDQINDSSTTYDVVIRNDISPLSEMERPQFGVYYTGILILEEI